MNNIKVLLADDHPMFREGLRNVLRSDPLFVVIGETCSGDETVRMALAKKPDIVIMDINMPIMDGIEATKLIKNQCPEIKILILTMYSDEAYLKESLEVGASAYLLKKAVNTELLTALRSVIEGQHYIYPTLLHGLYMNKKEPEISPSAKGDPLLSQREKEVLVQIALGHTQQEIANLLSISAKTVDTYKARIMEKIGATKRSDLVRYALKHNIISDKTI